MSKSSSEHVVIVGGGQAAMSVAAELRRLKSTAAITIIGEEPYLPYRRPPLSKGFLLGQVTEEQLLLRPATALAAAEIRCLTNCCAELIDREACTVRLSDGSVLNYSQLVLATGGRARTLPIAGAAAENVQTLRGIDDVRRLRTLSTVGSRAAIIGGGYIGLELAAVLRKQGVATTLIESQSRVLERAASPLMSQFLEGIHRSEGVDLRTGAQVSGFAGDARVTAIQLAGAEPVPVDFVVVGIGLEPRVDLAQAAGLAIDNGIVVDAACRTEDPRIYAVGDCSNHPSLRYKQRLRLESVQNAQDQGRIAARNIAGQAQVYDSLPWFWSDQYDMKLQMAGLRFGECEVIVRGEPDTQRSFSIFYRNNGVIEAADCVNRPADFMAVRKIIEAGTDVAKEALEDPEYPLSSLLR